MQTFSAWRQCCSLIAFAAALLASGAAMAQANLSPLIFPTTNEHVELVGTINSFDFASPQSSIRISVQGSAGQSIEWTVQTLAAAELRRNGWTEESLFSGEMVQVKGDRIAGQSLQIALTSITRANGQTLYPEELSLVDQITPGRYRSVPSSGFLDLYFDNFGFTKSSVRFANMLVDVFVPETGIEDSQARLQLSVENMLGANDITRMLKSADYLNASRFPMIEFSLAGIQSAEQNKFVANGDLLLLGASFNTNVFLTINRVDVHPQTEQITLGISGETRLSKSRMGFTTDPEGLADNVDVRFELQLQLDPGSAVNP